jgi:hypothetical protein
LRLASHVHPLWLSRIVPFKVNSKPLFSMEPIFAH